MDMDTFIRSLPKAELHLHIEGTLEPELKLRLAARNGIELPYASVEELRAAYDFDDLTSFLAQYYEGMSVLRVEADFYDLAVAYFERVAAQGLVYVEMFFDPQAHTSRGLGCVSGHQRSPPSPGGGRRSARNRSQLIMCFLRDHSVESASEALEQAAPYRDWIIGVGLDSDERDNPPLKFRDVFAAAREQGYRLTMHCDVDQQDSTTHIRQCLDDIGVERIWFDGLNALEDEGIVADLVRGAVGVTCCPISNSYVTIRDESAGDPHPHQRGVLVTVNSDDPAYFPGYVADNLAVLQREAELTRAEVVQLVRNAFTISWLDEPERKGYLDRLDAWVASH